MNWIISVILLIAAVICAIGWLCQWIGTAALTMYMLEKQYMPPTDSELKAYITKVWMKVLKIKR